MNDDELAQERLRRSGGEELPNLHPVYGYGHPPVIEFAAAHWDPRKFKQIFGTRAESLMKQWPELSNPAREALERVDAENGTSRVVDIDLFAGELYDAYWSALGGGAADWDELKRDTTREREFSSWLKTAEVAVALLGV